MRQMIKRIIDLLDGQPTRDTQRERGQSTLELALVMPILLVLVASIIEMGWFANNYLVLLEATRIGSRLGTQLAGDAGPIAWEMGDVSLDDGTTIPTRAATFPVDTHTDPFDKRWSNNVRDCGNSSLTLGFYSSIACATYTALIPLEETFDYDQFSTDLAADPDDSFDHEGELALNGLTTNDIVVSVFSLNRIPAQGADDCDDGKCDDTSGIVRPYDRLQQLCATNDPACRDRDSDGFYDGLPTQTDINGVAIPDTMDTNGAQVLVTGRYPTNANECNEPRDPFDITRNNAIDAIELDQTRITMINDEDEEVRFFDAGTDDGYRGFSLTGRWTVPDNPNCLGSEWGLTRVEDLVNLRSVTNLGPENLPEQQGLVLVEVFFEHQLLIELPLTGSFFSWTTADNDGIIKVWAAFPVGTVNFNISYSRECEDLVFSSTEAEITAKGVAAGCAAEASVATS